MIWPWVSRRRLEQKQRKLEAAHKRIAELRAALELAQQALAETKAAFTRIEVEYEELATKRARPVGADIRKRATQMAIDKLRETGRKR